MRKTIILILATLIAASGSEALAQTGNFSSSTGEKKEIKLNPYKGKGDDKSLFADVEAWYDSGSMTVTVEGCELKDTFIYIMSPDGVDENSSTTKAKYTWNYRTITYSL